MQTEANNKDLQWNILKRLQRLPYDQIGLIRRLVMHKTNCTQSKYYRVIQEKDNDVHVLIALAEVLKCKIDDIINSNYEFKDPQLSKELIDKLIDKKIPASDKRAVLHSKLDGQAK